MTGPNRSDASIRLVALPRRRADVADRRAHLARLHREVERWFDLHTGLVGAVTAATDNRPWRVPALLTAALTHSTAKADSRGETASAADAERDQQTVPAPLWVRLTAWGWWPPDARAELDRNTREAEALVVESVNAVVIGGAVRDCYRNLHASLRDVADRPRPFGWWGLCDDVEAALRDADREWAATVRPLTTPRDVSA